MAAHPRILAWKIPWTEEPGGLHSMRSQRVRHIHTLTHFLKQRVVQTAFKICAWHTQPQFKSWCPFKMQGGKNIVKMWTECLINIVASQCSPEYFITLTKSGVFREEPRSEKTDQTTGFRSTGWGCGKFLFNKQIMQIQVQLVSSATQQTFHNDVSVFALPNTMAPAMW